MQLKLGGKLENPIPKLVLFPNNSINSLLNAVTSSNHYINAKAVLLGEGGVGKSGLGIRIADKKFVVTEPTHGAQVWHISVNEHLSNHESSFPGGSTPKLLSLQNRTNFGR
jgi:GTPase SAR1 family protein